MVSSCEALVADTRAARHATREFWLPNAVYCRLVALQVCQSRELCVGCAAGDVAGPCSAEVRIGRGERGWSVVAGVPSLTVASAESQFSDVRFCMGILTSGDLGLLFDSLNCTDQSLPAIAHDHTRAVDPLLVGSCSG
jgi:hypothetical protein